MASTLLAERTYKLLREFFLELDNRNGSDFWKKEIALGNHSKIFIDHHMRSSTPESKLFVLMVDCIEDIRQAEAKSNGIKSIDKIMNKTCKENARNFGGSHPLIGGYVDDEGNKYVSNAYYLLKTDKNVNIPPIPENTSFPSGLVEYIKKYKYANSDIIECPSLAEIKSFIKLRKAEQDKNTFVYYKLYDAGVNSIWVDAEYLCRIIEFMDNNEIVCLATNDDSKKPTTPLYFTNGNGEEAILSPTKKY